MSDSALFTPLSSTMMPAQLLITEILERARHFYHQREIVSMLPVGLDASGKPIAGRHSTTYGAMAERALRLASALQAAGVQKGDRVATLAVNSYRHLEAYLGIPAMGGVLHTVNIRLHAEQIAWIINHAQDKVLLIDNLFAAMIPALRAACPSLQHIVVMGPLPQAIPGTLDYDTWLGQHEPLSQYPELHEDDAAGMCYTSGTTGNPKAVVYSHRSTVLHSLASAPRDALNVSQTDTVLPIVPMFHVNAWGLPYTCAMYGARLVFSGPFNDGAALARLMQDEKVTITAGVPTIWLGLLQELDRAKEAGTPYQLPLERLVCGGAAAPESLIRGFYERHALKVVHAWGMTETHPLGTSSIRPADVQEGSDEYFTLAAKQGIAVPLVQLALVSEQGEELPHDGKTMGRLLARGPWVTQSYYREQAPSSFVTLRGQQWFDTGDIATIDTRGFMYIQDRSKDLIKSGGEWISSVDMENALMAHPDVLHAAVIAIPDAKWDERPLAVVRLKEGVDTPTHADLNAFLAPRFAKWWLPDAYEFVSDIPIGATGKFLKRELREQYKDYKVEKGKGI